MINYKSFFAFTKEPFAVDINTSDIFLTPMLTSATERFLYAAELASIAVITGEVGAGKSTSLRYAASKLHPSQYKVAYTIGSTGSISEIIRYICIALGFECKTNSIAVLLKTFKNLIIEISQTRQRPVLVIDEAHLMRLDVFTHLHILTQFEMDSRPLLSIILSGQNLLIDKLIYHTSRPLASRVIARTHLDGLNLNEMKGYLNHHLQIAGSSKQLFPDETITAIHQGSGGLLRRANLLAKGALIAAATEESQIVSPEHVRIASTEII